MGLTDELKGRRVYFDSNIFIYLLSGFKELENQISELREGLGSGVFEAFASDLVLTEILPPLVGRGNGGEEERKALSLLDEGGAFHLVPASREVFVQAGLLRSRFGMMTPDALHVSFAIEGNCDAFLTNDKGIKCPAAVRRVILSENR